jgi:hypothetical protein
MPSSDAKNLSHDFPSGQIPLQAHLRSKAKLAVYRAAHLRRDADRVPALFGHQHRFDSSSVGQLQQVPPSAIRRIEPRHCFGQTEFELFLESAAEGRWKGTDACDAIYLALVKGLVNLPRTISRLLGSESLLNFRQVQTDQRLCSHRNY